MARARLFRTASTAALGLLLASPALAEDTAKVRFEGTTDEGTSLFVDDWKVAAPPATLDLRAGTHRFLLKSAEGTNLMLVAEVFLEGSMDLTVQLEPSASDAGELPSLRLSGTDHASRLQVVVDDRSLGMAPVDIPLASVERSLMIQGARGEFLLVELQGAAALPQPVAPDPTSPPVTGRVTLHSQELAGARVSVDGEPRGVLPLKLELSEGNHRFTIEPKDGEAFTLERAITFDAPGLGIVLMLDRPRVAPVE